MINRLIDLLNKHEQYRSRCINLSPSENVLSPNAKQAFQNDMGSRYYFDTAYSPSEGTSYSYAGTKYISSLLELCQQTAKRVLMLNMFLYILYPVILLT